MNRGLKIGLAVSILLNVFLICAGFSAAVYAHRKFNNGALPQPSPLAIAARGLDPAQRERLRQLMRVDTNGRKTDFATAREDRRKAAELAAQPNFDRPAIEAQLAAARAADQQGHTKLDAAVLDFMQTLPLDQRVKLAPGLKAPPKPRSVGQPAQAAKAASAS
jgi:uncharacterized membrane protein